MALTFGWTAALAEHEREVARFVAALARVEPAAWNRAPAPGKWSPAAVALHVCQAYQLGAAAAHGDSSMRLRVAPAVAWLYRTVLLPVVLATERFPCARRGSEKGLMLPPDRANASYRRRGLSHPLDSFSFTFEDPCGLRFDPTPDVHPDEWHFALFAPTRSHRVAVAVHRPAGICRMSVFDAAGRRMTGSLLRATAGVATAGDPV